ncbi:hypothetical protein AgCh_001787 [Apium graveolens]
MSTTSFNDLPRETTSEIFARLPVKDLIKSTSVNKAWYSLINNPSFISSQIRRCISNCHDNSLLIIPPITSIQNYCSLISTDTSSLIEKFDIPFETRSRSLKMITEVHGMLLLTDLHTEYASKQLYLWNPYVRRHRLLASSCFRKLLDDRNRTFRVVGMGFDKPTNDYKIVRIVYVRDDKDKLFADLAPKVEIFSLRKNTWRKLKDPGVPRLVYDHGVYFNGSYYWLELNQLGTERANGCYGTEMRIMSFDFHTELFGLLKVPDDVPCNLGRCPHKLMQVEDSLALCVIDAPHRDKGNTRFPFSIWLMRQENGVVSWTLRFRPLLKYFGSPLGITKNGTLIIESFRTNEHDETCIISCNIKSMIYKVHEFGIARNPISQSFFDVSTVDALFPESLIMYEGGKSLLKFSK